MYLSWISEKSNDCLNNYLLEAPILKEDFCQDPIPQESKINQKLPDLIAFHVWDSIMVLFLGIRKVIPWTTVQVKITFMPVKEDAHPETFSLMTQFLLHKLQSGTLVGTFEASLAF